MRWFLFILAGWLTLGALVAVATVGKPRKPLTGGGAVAIVLIDAVLVTGLVLAAIGLGRP